MSNIVVINCLVLNEVFIFLIDRIICQMHAEIIQITAEWWNIFFGRKASQAFFVKENSDGNNGSD